MEARRWFAMVPAAMLMAGASVEAMAGTWVVQKENLATILMGVDFLDTQVGYVAGGNDGVGPVIFRTSDGGRTWVQQVEGMPSASYMDVSFGDDTHAVAGGMGMFYVFAGASYTQDGRTWSASKDRWLASAYQDVEAVDARSMYLIGTWARMTSYGEGVAASRDGGQTFHYFDWGMGTAARYGSFVSPTTGYVAGGQWPYDDSARFGAGSFRVNKHVALPMIDAPAREDSYDGYICIVGKTTSGGADWEVVFEDYGNFYCNGIHFVDENNGWFVAEGDDGAYIFHTADGGATWDEQHFEPDGSLIAVHMVNESEGWAAGASIIKFGFKALFLHTVDGGATWEKLDTDLKHYIFNIDSVDPDHLWAVSYGSGGCSVLQYQP